MSPLNSFTQEKKKEKKNSNTFNTYSKREKSKKQKIKFSFLNGQQKALHGSRVNALKRDSRSMNHRRREQSGSHRKKQMLVN